MPAWPPRCCRAPNTRNYRHALFDKGSLDQLSARIDAQVGMLLNGMKA